ncbi:MAG: hypothetical protein M5T61_09425 [Acidimicrobiia bacterium]|nr:hypothetical protein [Acidimicrobiia bacterium]
MGLGARGRGLAAVEGRRLDVPRGRAVRARQLRPAPSARGRPRHGIRSRIALAPEAGTRLLELGFSDRAVVYLNGRQLFRGDETYRSRDYRFLGSIGYFHGVYLPLEAGDNELVVAVSESFGGWGLMARLPDGNGITLDADVS